MKLCAPFQPVFRILLILVCGLMSITTIQFTLAFSPTKPSVSTFDTGSSLQRRVGLQTYALPEEVQVCGFKDCRRAGGGARLEKLVSSILEEKGEADSVKIEICDCQGECGYGPNLVVDGKLINGVRGREAVMNALGMEEENPSTEE